MVIFQNCTDLYKNLVYPEKSLQLLWDNYCPYLLSFSTSSHQPHQSSGKKSYNRGTVEGSAGSTLRLTTFTI